LIFITKTRNPEWRKKDQGRWIRGRLEGEREMRVDGYVEDWREEEQDG